MSIPKCTSDNPLRQGVDGENRDFYPGANTSQAIAYNIREVKLLGKENGSAVSDSSLLERVAGGRRWILISRLTLEFAYGQIVLPNEYQKPLSCPQTTERNFMNLRLLPTLGAFGCA